MTNKVKVTQKRAEYLKLCVNKEQLLLAKSTGLLEQGRDEPIGNMSFDDLVKALYIGYEVVPQFKVGEWVVKKKQREIIGKLYMNKINHLDVDRGEKTGLSFDSDSWEHATPKEIKAEKERQLWRSIGREVGEFRDGDVRINDDGITINIVDVEYAKVKYVQGKLKGFYPVETFISFEELE